ncbi:MAG: CPBP family intramembrane metalloprotease [Candidatus Diapherotrites archaeon]|nr:CPBP family intramembrane metalloprotease [Candidatus Diapherotrites archaeon]
MNDEQVAMAVLFSSTIILLLSLNFVLFSREIHNLVFYLAIPSIILLTCGKKLKEYFSINAKEFFCKEFLLVFAVFLISVIAASRIAEFKNYYGSYSQALVSNPLYFIGASIIILFSWEFLFRSFMIKGMKSFGKSAVLIQAIPFAFMHFGKPALELYASFFAGILLGYLALKQESFIGAFLLHLMVYLLIPLLVLF